jgi:hypothetical protein
MNRLNPFIAICVLVTAPAPLFAQATAAPRLMRGDVSGTVGWASTNKSEFESYNNWHSQGEASHALGWYWTDHHKTEVEVGATTERSTYAATPFVATSGLPATYIPSHRTFSSRRFAVIQHYQFRRNEWVHPFLGAGLDIVRERESRRDEPVFSYDPVTRQSRVARDAVQYGETTDVDVRTVLTGGVKAYFTRKVFGLTDVRVSVGRRRAEDVHWRFGLGVDF